MTARAKAYCASEGPSIRRATFRGNPPARDEEKEVVLALVDELAVLAAELWFAGRLDRFPMEEEETSRGEDE